MTMKAHNTTYYLPHHMEINYGGRPLIVTQSGRNSIIQSFLIENSMGE